MKTEIRNISPSIAKEMLKRNFHNRKTTNPHVNFLAKEMKEGRWVFTGESIKLTSDGSLLDGQHRLQAIVESGTTQKFLIVSGITKEAFKAMDTGRNRSAGDIFSIKGYKNYNELSSITRKIICYKKGDPTGKGSGIIKPSNFEILDFFEKSKRIESHYEVGRKYYKVFSKIISVSNLAFMSFIFSEKNVTDSEIFIRKLCTGLDLKENSPIHGLRKILTDDAISERKLTLRYKYALIYKAWNMFREKKQLTKKLSYTKDEKFPKIK